MKTIFQLLVAAILTLAAISCKKAEVIAPRTDGIVQAALGKIDPSITEPSNITLGTSSAVMHDGDNVTIFLPYDMTDKNFVSSTITLTDDATGLPVATLNLLPNTDASASSLNFPANMYGGPGFFFVRFTIDSNYSGKTISISTSVDDGTTVDTDTLNQAFSVEL